MERALSKGKNLNQFYVKSFSKLFVSFQLGMEHPITTFIRSITTDEEEDRRKRIEDISIQSALSEARLSKIAKSIPYKLKESDIG